MIIGHHQHGVEIDGQHGVEIDGGGGGWGRRSRKASLLI